MTAHRIEFDKLLWETPMKGLRYKAFRQGASQLRLVEYTPDMELHWCEKGHIGYMLEGRFEIRFPDGVEIYEPGDGIFIQSGARDRHMGKALTDVVKVVFVEDV